VLQAIALTTIGSQQINNLAEPVLDHLRDRRLGADGRMEIFSRFSFSDIALRKDIFPGLAAPVPRSLRLDSSAYLLPKSSLLSADSRYSDYSGEPTRETLMPLDRARDLQHKLWFVAGYGPARHLPESGFQPELKFPYLDRLRPLFNPRAPITSTAFANHFGKPDEDDGPRGTRANLYSRVLREVLFHTTQLLPTLQDIELRGQHGVKNTSALQESARFMQEIGHASVKIPAVSLAHGHQSTIAWIADLVGHVILEANTELAPADMRGLVLIDEIDLYLHPTWQVVLIRALKQTLPGLQFVVTTHSPLVLAALDPHEDQVVRLVQNPDTGDVEARAQQEDPRLLTASEILQFYFELDDLHPDPLGRLVRDYLYLASNPYRTDADDAQLAQWRHALAEANINPNYAPVPRREFVRGRP